MVSDLARPEHRHLGAYRFYFFMSLSCTALSMYNTLMSIEYEYTESEDATRKGALCAAY
jgi:hypothetical protein